MTARARGGHALPGATRVLAVMLMLAPRLTRVGVSWKLKLTLSSEQAAPCEALLFQMCTHLGRDQAEAQGSGEGQG